MVPMLAMQMNISGIPTRAYSMVTNLPRSVLGVKLPQPGEEIGLNSDVPQLPHLLHTDGGEDRHAVHQGAGEGPHLDSRQGASVSLSRRQFYNLLLITLLLITYYQLSTNYVLIIPYQTDQLLLVTERSFEILKLSQTFPLTHSLMASAARPLQTSLSSTLYLAVMFQRDPVHRSRASAGLKVFLFVCSGILSIQYLYGAIKFVRFI